MSNFLIKTVHACFPAKPGDCADWPPEPKPLRESVINIDKIGDFANDHQLLSGFIVAIVFISIMTLVAHILKKYRRMRLVRRIVRLLFYTMSVIVMLLFGLVLFRFFGGYASTCIGCAGGAWHDVFPGFLVFPGISTGLWFIGYIFRK